MQRLNNTQHFAANKQQGSVLIIVLIFAVLFMALAGGGAYFYKKNQQQMELLNQYVAKVETELELKTQSANEFKVQLAKVSADLITQDSAMDSRLKALGQDLERVSSKVKDAVEATSSQSWLLAEVEYLLKMADHRILMKEDVKGAITVLKSADELLKKMPIDDAGLREVRVSIAKDIAGLETYSAVDVPGTYAALVALGDTIEKLELMPTQMPEEQQEQAEQTAPEKSKVDVLAIINDTMGGYLKVKHYSTEELKVLLSTDERRNLRDSMRLVLEQAQTALLRGDQIVYDKSLAKIRNWLLNYFSTSDFRVELAINKVEALSSVTVQNELPDIAGAQQTLKRYLADRMRRGEY